MDTTSTWRIDPAHSSIEFAVKHMMFTTVRGRFRDFTGTVSIDPDNPDRSRVEIEIDAASIETGAEDRDIHLRSGDFFDVENHPAITFRSTRVEGAHGEEGDRFSVTGELTVRDTTMEITLETTFQGMGDDPWGGQRAGFSASTDLDRRDWGLRWNQTLETGGILVANHVRIELEIQAVRTAGEQREAA